MQIRDRSRHKDELTLNMTPLIDVVFLLLLFFVVSTTFKQSTKLELDLPKATAQSNKSIKPKTAIEPIEIGINAKGYYFLQKKPLNSGDSKILKQALTALIIKDKQAPEVMIMGDKLAPHQAVVSAMDIVGQLGIKQLKIMANT